MFSNCSNVWWKFNQVLIATKTKMVCLQWNFLVLKLNYKKIFKSRGFYIKIIYKIIDSQRRKVSVYGLPCTQYLYYEQHTQTLFTRLSLQWKKNLKTTHYFKQTGYLYILFIHNETKSILNSLLSKLVI